MTGVQTCALPICGELEAEAGAALTPGALILFGGGAALLADVLPDSTRFVRLDHPEFANANGFAVLARR